MADEAERNPTYGSANDLPRIKDLRRSIQGLKVLGKFSRLINTADLETQEAKLAAVVRNVDRFYSQLGSRNWVYHETLSNSLASKVADAESPDAAEQLLVEYYMTPDAVWHLLHQVKALPEARSRAHLIDWAYRDLQEGRYYSTVLLMITVVDGIANDVDKHNRQGLSTRDPSEMVPLDSIMAHHRGLSNAIRVFNRGVYATDESETHDVLRNGIIHGMTLNYNNKVVATKSLNLLFAVGDWVRIQKKLSATKDRSSVRATLDQLRRNQKIEEELANFTREEINPGDAEHSSSEIYQSINAFLAAWSRPKPNYKTMAETTARAAAPDQITTIKSLFREHVLSGYEIHAIHRTALHAATCNLSVTVDGSSYRCTVRLQYCEPTGPDKDPVRETGWHLSPYGPEQFLRNAWLDTMLET